MKGQYHKNYQWPVSAILTVCFCVITFSCSQSVQKETTEYTTTDTVQKHREDYLLTCKTLFAEARLMDSILLQQTEINKSLANKAIKAFTAFAYHCAEDSLSPVYLIKTAQVAQALNYTEQAKIALESCINNYFAFKDRAAAIFLLAQLYDEPVYLNNEQEARRLYNKILDEYPTSDWAASAKGAIDFLGKTDVQILHELTKKKK